MKRLLLIGLSVLTIMSITACGKTEEETPTTENNNYAVNEVRDTTEEDEDESEEEITQEQVVSENTTEESEEEIPPEFIAKDQIYNVEDDVNARDIRDMNTISIDGNLIGFPLDYNYLTTIFNNLYTKGYVGVYENTFPIDLETKSTQFEVYADPKTGTGVICFTFTSIDGKETTIDKMVCNKVYLRGGNTKGDKVMTIALPQFIKFGSSYEELTSVFNWNPSKAEVENGKTDFRLTYYSEDGTQKYEFVGYDGGLNMVTLTYNVTN